MRKKRFLHMALLALSALICLAMLSPVFASEEKYDPDHPENLEKKDIRAESAILINANSGMVLFEKNADELRYPASTTKIMTALLGYVSGADLEAPVSVSANAANIPEDASRIGLQAGEELKLGDLLKATMVASGNDGAIAIAEFLSQNEEAFARLMNEKAAMLGCTHTHFVNSHGYHNDYHVSSARDLALIAQAAMEIPAFRETAKLYKFTLPADNLSKSRSLSGQQRAFFVADENNDYSYPYAIGIKTGYHTLAGYCYVGAAEKDGITLINVVLKTSSAGRWTDTKKLMNYGFSQYLSTSIEKIYQESPKVVEISGFSPNDAELGRLQLALNKMEGSGQDVLVTSIAEKDRQMILYKERTSIEFSRPLVAPVTQGEVMGTLSFTPEDGGTPVKYELVATRNIERRPAGAPSLDEIKAYTENDPNPFPRLTAELVFWLVFPLIILFSFFRFLIILINRFPKRKNKLKTNSGYSTRFYR